MPIVPRDTDAPPDQTTPTLAEAITAEGTLADRMYEQLLAADQLTTDELETLISRAGRNEGPVFLATAYAENLVEADTVTALVGGIWSSAEFPDRYLDHGTWRGLFNVAGFTIDGKPAERPTAPLTLYRGTVPERRADWSWSRDRAVAERFAAGLRGRGTGRLWVCTVPPESMLAVNTERDEDEVVVDTRGLQILEVLR
jgi:hypothetical protein